MNFLKKYNVSNQDGTTFMYYLYHNRFQIRIVNITFDIFKEGNYWIIYYQKRMVGSSHIKNCYHRYVPPIDGWDRGDRAFLNAFSKTICKYNYKLMMMRFFDNWNYRNHHLFIKEARDYIVDIFMIFNRIEKIFKRIPPEIIAMILENLKQLDLIIY